MDDKPISRDLDRLLEFYAALSLEEREHWTFCAVIRRLIVECSEPGKDKYNEERAEEWREIAYALGDNDPDCSGLGHWAGEVKKHSAALRKIIEGGAA